MTAEFDPKTHAGFTRLFRETRGDLLRFVVRRAGNPGDAADIVAEAYLAAWTGSERVPADPHEARLWIFGIARNILRTETRRGQARAQVVDHLAHELEGALNQAPTNPDSISAEVGAALAALSETDQEILTLTAWEQLTPGEIGLMLGLNANLVRVRLHRARRKLGASLGPIHRSALHQRAQPPPDDRPHSRAVVSSTSIAGGDCST